MALPAKYAKLPERRSFNGKTYRLMAAFRTKREAKTAARKFRAARYFCRIVPFKNAHCVYARVR